MDILTYIKSKDEELKKAYTDIGNRIYWKTRFGGDIRVCEMESSHIEEVLNMLYDNDPSTFWIEIFENEIRRR